jgi:hypothetical protein
MKIPFHIGLLTLLLVILLVLVSGCTQKSRPEPGLETGPKAELGEPFRPITLHEGLSEVYMTLTGEQQSNEHIPLYYFQARGISSEGKAEQWIFGIKYQNDSYFVEVESNRVILVPGQVTLPQKEIDTSTIIEPGALITMNGSLIGRTFGIPETSILLDLEMSENIYAVTPQGSNAYRILYFDALTGKSLN